VNSAVGSGLIAGILSGVFVIVGILLGATLQRRSTDQERIRADGAMRDEILARLSGPITALITQARELHHLVPKPDDPQLERLKAQMERLHRDLLQASSEISVLFERLEYLEPAMLPVIEQATVAIEALLTGTRKASDSEFNTRIEQVKSAGLAMNRKRHELAAEAGPGGRRAKRRQPDRNKPKEIAAE
jgi:hypothetical protein